LGAFGGVVVNRGIQDAYGITKDQAESQVKAFESDLR